MRVQHSLGHLPLVEPAVAVEVERGEGGFDELLLLGGDFDRQDRGDEFRPADGAVPVPVERVEDALSRMLRSGVYPSSSSRSGDEVVGRDCSVAASARSSSGARLRRDGRTPSLWRSGVTERVSRAAAATEVSGRKR